MEAKDDRRATLPEGSPRNCASLADRLEILGRLLDSFPEANTSDDAKASRLRGYAIACEDVSLEALLAVERAIYRGEAKIDPRFMPRPPELAGLCRQIDAERRWAALPKLPPPDLSRFEAPPDAAMVRKIDALVGMVARTAYMTRSETPVEWRKRMIAEGRLKPPEATA